MEEDSYEESKLKFNKSVLNEIRPLKNLMEDRVGMTEIENFWCRTL